MAASLVFSSRTLGDHQRQLQTITPGVQPRALGIKSASPHTIQRTPQERALPYSTLAHLSFKGDLLYRENTQFIPKWCPAHLSFLQTTSTSYWEELESRKLGSKLSRCAWTLGGKRQEKATCGQKAGGIIQAWDLPN